MSQEAREKAEALARRQETELKLCEIERRRKVREAQIAALQAELEADTQEATRITLEGERLEAAIAEDREVMARLRKADVSSKA